VLLVSSSGGVLLDLLALEPWWSRFDTTWAAVRAADTEDLLSTRQVHWIKERRIARPLGVFPGLIEAWRILCRVRPDVLVSAGSGCAVGFFLAAKLLGVPGLWVSTLNVVATPGWAERVCSSLAGAVLVQQESLLAAHARAVVVGQLY
jgi:UDP-N-acetylglucosamine:LPS N-acetylglucosamine transferase